MTISKIYKVSVAFSVVFIVFITINFYGFYNPKKFFSVPFFTGNSGEQVEIDAVVGLEVKDESINLSELSKEAYSGFFDHIKSGDTENILVDEAYKNRITKNINELKELWKTRTLSIIEYSFILGAYEYVLLSYTSNNERRTGYYRFKIINDDYIYSPFGKGDFVEKLLRELTMVDILKSLTYKEYVEKVLLKDTIFTISEGAKIYLNTGLGFQNEKIEGVYLEFLEALNEKQQAKFRDVFTTQEYKRSSWMFDEKYNADYSSFKSSFNIAKVKAHADLGSIYVLYLEVEETPLWQPVFFRKDSNDTYKIFGIGSYSDSLDRFRSESLIKEML